MKSYLLLFTIATLAIPLRHGIAADGNKAGVLELEVISGRAKHRRAASEMTRSLRSVIRGQRRWQDVGKLSASLSDARDAFGCEPQNIVCMKGLAGTLGLDVLIWGLVDGTGPVERIQLWAVSTQGQHQHLDIPLKVSSPHLNYRKNAKKLLRDIIKKKEHLTQVRIQTDPSGAIIQIKGENVGLSPVVVSLREGSYEVEISAEGYDLLEKRLVVPRSSNLEKNWQLRPSSLKSVANGESSTSIKETVRWSALGIALTSIAATAYFSSEAYRMSVESTDRINCNTGLYETPNDCGPDGSISLLYREEYEQLRSDFKNSKYMMIGSLVVSGIAASVFGGSFVF